MNGTKPGRLRGRARLAVVLRALGPLLTPGEVAGVLGITATDAAKLLSRWVSQGWLTRIRRGLYAVVPLDAVEPVQVLSNPWVLVPRLYAPGYVGGWSAAEHWDLTEQIFRSLCVLTATPVRAKEQTVQGLTVTLTHVPEEAIFGTRSVWEGRDKIAVSNPHRTIIDMMDDPRLGGGLQHVSQCLGSYLDLEESDPMKLIEYGDRLGRGTIFKRLGFLLERSGRGDEKIIDACALRLTAGNSKLDPGQPCRRLVRRWRLFVPERWAKRRRRD